MAEVWLDDNLDDAAGGRMAYWRETARFLRPYASITAVSTNPRKAADETWAVSWKLARLFYDSDARHASESERIDLAQRHLWIISNVGAETKWKDAAGEWAAGGNTLPTLQDLVVAELKARLPRETDRRPPRQGGPRPSPAERRRVVAELDRILGESVKKSMTHWHERGPITPRLDIDYDVLVRHRLCKRAWGQFLADGLVRPSSWFDEETRSIEGRLDVDARRRLQTLQILQSDYFVMRAAAVILWPELVDMHDQAAQLFVAVRAASGDADGRQAIGLGSGESPTGDDDESKETDLVAVLETSDDEREIDAQRDAEDARKNACDAALEQAVRTEVHTFRDNLIGISEATIDAIKRRRYRDILRCARESEDEENRALLRLDPPQDPELDATKIARSRARALYLRGLAEVGVLRGHADLPPSERLGVRHVISATADRRYRDLAPDLRELRSAEERVRVVLTALTTTAASVPLKDLDDALQVAYRLRIPMRAELTRRGARAFFDKRLVELPGNLPRHLRRTENQGPRKKTGSVADYAAQKGIVLVVPPGIDNIRELDDDLFLPLQDARAALLRALLNDGGEGRWWWFPGVRIDV